ncbi:VOC family protein [Nodosilinea sp. P-1105]|uniref:VOC family protein n=1 Tax=Nodosilinea sp. P-1105 TaxID=2546229 RepID=UPI00146B8F3A|nr:VOC family protein [Nodosilinea sp. P-1105]NMF84046.1 VOC family protein [Nodosilinea sp. P-1105]
MLHHASIRTQDIHRAIDFYEHLGFVVHERFTAGITLACWMEGLGGRIELIQVPEPRPAADAFGDEHYSGYYHLSFDLTELTPNLPDWVNQLRSQMAGIKVLLEPQQQIIGDRVYEVAFIADADGLPLEFIRVLGHVQP